MNYLQKIWVRVLISLFVGGILTEIIHISTGDPNRPVSEGSRILPLFYGLIIYFAITYILKKTGKIK